MKSLNEIRQEREAAQAKYQKDKEQKEVTGVAGKTSIFKEYADTKYAIRWVHGFENSADFMYHIFHGDLFCKEICEEHYNGQTCKYCKSVSTKTGKARFASGTKFFMAHVYNLVGKEFPLVDKSTGETKICKWNPL